jgi:L-malate glycosyltransferase
MAKVAFISHSYVESAYRTKLTYLAQATELRLVTPSWYPTRFGRYEVDFEFNSDVPVESYPVSFVNFKRTSTRWLLRSRDLGFAEFQPEIIHIENEPHSWIVCQTLLYRRLFAPRAKVVIFHTENLSPEEQGRKSRTLEHLASFNRQFVDFFICANKAGKEILLGKGIPAAKIEVLPQIGIDPDVFFPYPPLQREAIRRELGIFEAEFVIGFVGRFVEEKGLLDLVEAVGGLRASSKRELVLMLFGKGPLEESVRVRAGKLGIKLVILPSRKYQEVAATINALDVLVLPSRSRTFWKEQFGQVLTEAMACGVPVIGSDSGEIPNVIGDAGLIFREGNVEQLSECLRLWCDNEPLRLELGKRGLDRVLKNFTNREIARRTLEIYERVIEQPDFCLA